MLAIQLHPFVGIGLFILGTVFVFLAVKALPRLFPTTSRAEMYSERGGATWGSTKWSGINVSWPFAKLSAWKDLLIIEAGVLNKLYSFERSEVVALRRTRGLFGSGLKIEHTKAGDPPLLRYWPSDFERLRRELERLGYEVTVG